MRRPLPFNPGRFADALIEGLYIRGWGKGRVQERKREKLINWLRKKWRDDRACMDLADKLEACKPDSRCKSAGCPACATAAQRLFASIGAKFLKERTDGNEIVRVSSVPADGLSKPGHLSEAQHQRNLRRWKEALGRASIEWFIGAVDYSFNEHAQGRYEPHWSEHLYGFTITSDPAGLKGELLELFPRTDAVPRPVTVEPWDGDKDALRYCLKPNSWRRIGTDHAERFDERTDGQRSCRATDKQRLRSSQRRELLLHLDSVGLQGRLFFRRVQFVNLRGVGPAIVKRVPRARSREKRGESA